MSGINRRKMLQAMGAATAGAAATALGTQPVLAALSSPIRGLRYQMYGGHNFTPRSTVRDGNRRDWTYNNNGSIWSSGAVPDLFLTRLQLPQGAVIEDVQWNISLGDASASMRFELLGFDLQNGAATLAVGFATLAADHIQTVSMNRTPFSEPNPDQPGGTLTWPGLPATVDNSAWNYVLRWTPGANGPTHILWGARVGYRSHRSDEGLD
jgi:hypothetical protein